VHGFPVVLTSFVGRDGVVRDAQRGEERFRGRVEA
jgi:hypothetical protein